MNKILILLALALVAGTFGMVALYNATVNTDHNIAKAKAELDTIGAQATALNNTVVATLSGAALANLAAKEGLVSDSKPQYFTASPNDLSLHAINR